MQFPKILPPKISIGVSPGHRKHCLMGGCWAGPIPKLADSSTQVFPGWHGGSAACWWMGHGSSFTSSYGWEAKWWILSGAWDLDPLTLCTPWYSIHATNLYIYIYVDILYICICMVPGIYTYLIVFVYFNYHIWYDFTHVSFFLYIYIYTYIYIHIHHFMVFPFLVAPNEMISPIHARGVHDMHIRPSFWGKIWFRCLRDEVLVQRPPATWRT